MPEAGGWDLRTLQSFSNRPQFGSNCIRQKIKGQKIKRQKIKTQKIKRQKIKRQKIKWQRNEKAENGRRCLGLVIRKKIDLLSTIG